MSNKLGDLVKKAKGEDRSLREYARDSGVDAAIISKMITGSYVPKNAKIYQSLTSVDAAPRGGVSFDKLIKASNTTKDFQAGLKAGLSVTGRIISSNDRLLSNAELTGTTNLKEYITAKKNASDIKLATEYINQIQGFVATSNGLLFKSLGEHNIRFTIKAREYNGLDNQYDTWLSIDNEQVSEYLLRYAYFPSKYEEEQYVENTFKMLIGELVFLKPTPHRKVSVIVNSDTAFETIVKFRDLLSYNGELSIVLVDTKNTKLLKETYLSHFLCDYSIEEFFIV
jgi:hypothetical protein